jgi:uncharacterized protein
MKIKMMMLLILSVMVTRCANAAEVDIAKSCREQRVCDLSNLLSPEQARSVSEYHQALLERYDIDLRVVISSYLGELGPKAVAVFKDLNIGEKSTTRKGVLLVIDPGQDKVRMEVSAGLDAVYTDGFVTYLQNRQMVPFFTAARVADGVMATTELIVDRAQKAAKNEEFVNPDVLPKNLAIGAGAQTTASIGKGYQASSGGADVTGAGMSPLDVVAAYHQALSQGNASPSLSIYSRATQNMKKSWVVTPAQMRMELSMYQSCQIDKVAVAGQMAFVRYGVRQRQCAPYFLVKEDGEWKLDFSTMMQVIRFNIDNKWHFDMGKTPQSILNEFSDWRFDENGYPY